MHIIIKYLGTTFNTIVVVGTLHPTAIFRARARAFQIKFNTSKIDLPVPFCNKFKVNETNIDTPR